MREVGQGSAKVIAFGVAVTSPSAYDRYAFPGIQRVAEPDSLVMAHQTAGSIFHNYNLLLDKAGEREDLEALVLPHQDTEIVDPEFLTRIRQALADPDFAVIGCAGAVGVRSPAWWQGAVTWASMTHRYQEYGGGEFPGPTWIPDTTPSYASPGEVDAIDGFLDSPLALGGAQPAVRRVPGDAARVRLRHLHAGAAPPARRSPRRTSGRSTTTPWS